MKRVIFLFGIILIVSSFASVYGCESECDGLLVCNCDSAGVGYNAWEQEFTYYQPVIELMPNYNYRADCGSNCGILGVNYNSWESNVIIQPEIILLDNFNYKSSCDSDCGIVESNYDSWKGFSKPAEEKVAVYNQNILVDSCY